MPETRDSTPTLRVMSPHAPLVMMPAFSVHRKSGHILNAQPMKLDGLARRDIAKPVRKFVSQARKQDGLRIVSWPPGIFVRIMK